MTITLTLSPEETPWKTWELVTDSGAIVGEIVPTGGHFKILLEVAGEEWCFAANTFAEALGAANGAWDTITVLRNKGMMP